MGCSNPDKEEKREAKLTPQPPKIKKTAKSLSVSWWQTIFFLHQFLNETSGKFYRSFVIIHSHQ
jgi:hypothetical protein